MHEQREEIKLRGAIVAHAWDFSSKWEFAPFLNLTRWNSNQNEASYLLP